MNEKRYILKKGDYYLSDVDVTLDLNDNIVITHFELDEDFRKLFDDFEKAEEIRKSIYIETGLDFTVKLFKGEE